ncbi:YicC/YloC family endoribonuclease [Hyphomonas sp.]|uniref:YicC/YloC family endoribonuclease n=1 Tax=Hyphomonas sp. TaxID=87 RepID=UPI00391BF7D6
MNTLSGMTGFARTGGEADWGRWAWEARSVNGRALDVRLNLPPNAEMLEPALKALAAERFHRGSLQISLRIEIAGGGARAEVNPALLADLAAALREATGTAPGPEALATLMGLKGVVETGAVSLRDIVGTEETQGVLIAGAATALDELRAARQREGASLHALLTGALNEMHRLRGEAESHAAAQPGLIRERLMKQLEELDREGRVDAERFAVEAAMTAARADIREELDRLAAHIRSGHELLAAGSPAGRKLDFLAQELNREANTLCSKSASLALTNAGLGLKGLIDQFKEQSANVE